MSKSFEEFEDKLRIEKTGLVRVNRYSRYCDFIFYPSSLDPQLILAMRVLKPEKPSYILAGTHGWHMSIPEFVEYAEPQSEYLQIQVDMRGRAFSDGTPDCNGLELFDIIDAIEYVKEHYKEYIIDPDIVFFQAGSGGCGNAFTIAGNFHDYFSHILTMTAMSDYALWYRNDAVGEFRDELDVWIGDISNQMAYDSRSGITFVENLCAPMALIHGDGDIRVPEYHTAIYIDRAKTFGKHEMLTYLKLPGIGGADHFTNITPEGMAAVREFCDSERKKHMSPVRIPRRGSMVIGGYLVTKDFSVMLNSKNKVARIDYDLDEAKFKITGVDEGEYVIRFPRSPK